MRKGISEIVGRADATDHGEGVVYRALRRLICTVCANVIAEGDLFTRRTLPGYGLRIISTCQRCAPLTPQHATTRNPSELIEHLLSPQPEKSARPTQNDARQQKNLAEAMEQRLGPALRRRRRVS